MKIFVSHASYDGAAIRALVQDLGGAGKQVWLDQDLRGGEAWWTSILEHIRACKVFVFAVSDNSLRSKPCRAELEYASALGLPILPVQIGEVTSFRIDSVFATQSIDYRKPTSTTAAALIGAVDDRARDWNQLPDPLPDPPPIPYEYLQRLGEAINGPAPISYQEQTEILTQLRSAYRDETDPDAHADVRRLLDSLQQRPDTARTTVDEIASIYKTTPRPDPPHNDRTPLLRRSWGRHRALVITTIILIALATISVTGYLVKQHPKAPPIVAPIVRLALSDDGFGIVVGDKNAPAKIDIFMEPQCEHCARFNARNGEEIALHIEDGGLQVTYRPLAFFDDNNNDYSKRAANAMFLAASPTSGTSPRAFKSFMSLLYNPIGGGRPDGEAIVGFAETSGIPSQVADRIAAKDKGVDVVKMAEVNDLLLRGAVGNDVAKALRSNHQPPDGEFGVPRVYDVVHQDVVDTNTDIGNGDWLNHLTESSANDRNPDCSSVPTISAT